MSEEKITLTRAQFNAWIHTTRPTECLWTSLKSFVDVTTPLPPRAPRVDRAAVCAQILEVTELFSVTPYTFIWPDHHLDATVLEVVFMEDPGLEVREAIKLAVPELEVLFSKWNGVR